MVMGISQPSHCLLNRFGHASFGPGVTQYASPLHCLHCFLIAQSWELSLFAFKMLWMQAIHVFAFNNVFEVDIQVLVDKLFN